MRSICTLLLALLIVTPAAAQCRGGSCGPAFAPSLAPGYFAQPFAPSAPITAPPRPSLEDGVLREQVRVLSNRLGRLSDKVRGLEAAARERAALERSRAMKAAAPPSAPTLLRTAPRLIEGGPEPADPPPMPTGVDASKLSDHARCLLGGKEISRERAIQLIEGDDSRVPDDTGLIRVILAGGTDAQRKAVLDDLDRVPASIRGKFVVHAYPADSPMVKDRGYVATGSPSITVTDGSGKVIARNLDGAYRGATALYGAIERAAKYDPAKDKDLWSGGGIDLAVLWAQVQKVPAVVWVGGGLAVLWYLNRRREQQQQQGGK